VLIAYAVRRSQENFQRRSQQALKVTCPLLAYRNKT